MKGRRKLEKFFIFMTFVVAARFICLLLQHTKTYKIIKISTNFRRPISLMQIGVLLFLKNSKNLLKEIIEYFARLLRIQTI